MLHYNDICKIRQISQINKIHSHRMSTLVLDNVLQRLKIVEIWPQNVAYIIKQNTGLFEMIVGVLTTCHTQYTWDRSICFFFYLIEQHSKFLLHTLQVLYMCTLCDCTTINTIIEFVTNCLQHVSGDGFNGGSDSYLQFRDTCGKRRKHKIKKYIHSYLKCIVYDKLLKPRQSFRITL